MEEIKHITFERSGGFANIRFAADFELDELPDDQAHQLKELFDDLDFERIAVLQMVSPTPSQWNQRGANIQLLRMMHLHQKK